MVYNFSLKSVRWCLQAPPHFSGEKICSNTIDFIFDYAIICIKGNARFPKRKRGVDLNEKEES